jgi:hypothetical protein
MRVHVDLLGYLHFLWGAFGVLTGASLAVLAVGTNAAAIQLGSVGPAEQAAVWLFLICGVVLGGFGVAMLVVGRALHRRWGRGRMAAIACAVPNLVAVPFGTALAVYTLWVLQNDDARGQFGRPPHTHPAPRSSWVEGR